MSTSHGDWREPSCSKAELLRYSILIRYVHAMAHCSYRIHLGLSWVAVVCTLCCLPCMCRRALVNSWRFVEFRDSWTITMLKTHGKSPLALFLLFSCWLRLFLGITLGWLLESRAPLERELSFYLQVSLLLLLSTLMIYWTLIGLGVDLNW